jgi:membrane dipeptidase
LRARFQIRKPAIVKADTSLLFSVGLALLCAPAQAQQIDRKTKARIDRILKTAPLIDGHNDLPDAIRSFHGGLIDAIEKGNGDRPLMTDVARLRAGHVGGQFWSVYIAGTVSGDQALRNTIEQIDMARRIIAAHPRDLQLTGTAEEVVAAHRAGKIASLLGMEGGRQIAGSFAALRQFHALGVRYMTLTHNQTTEWADSATDEPKHGGLSRFGEQVVREMNRISMMVDLSHVSPDTMRDALRVSRAPVIFSHSNVYALSPHPRNVPDDVLRLVKDNGGIVMVTFYPSYVSPAAMDWARGQVAEQARLKAVYPFSSAQAALALAHWERAHPRPHVSIAELADHIDYIVRIAGHDHVGIGGDLDGIKYAVDGLDSPAGYPLLFAELIHRGWSDRDLAKLAGGNILRVMRRSEQVAMSMRNVPPALDRLEPLE